MSYDAERIKGYLTNILQSPPITVGEYELWIETKISMTTPSGGWISITGGEPSKDYAVIFRKKKSSDKVLSSFHSYRDALNTMAMLIRAFEITQGVELPEIKGD